MSQTSLIIANVSHTEYRAQDNARAQALASCMSGPVAPSSPVGGMLWLDTSVSPAVLRQRNLANSAWGPLLLVFAGDDTPEDDETLPVNMARLVAAGAATTLAVGNLASGAPGAPRIAHRAITPLYLGGSNGNGAAYSFTLIGVEDIGMIDGQITWNAQGGDQIVFQASTNGGSTWGTQQNLFVGSSSGADKRFVLNLVTGAWRVHPNYSGTLTIPPGCNAIRIKPDAGAAVGTTLAIMAWAAGGIID